MAALIKKLFSVKDTCKGSRPDRGSDSSGEPRMQPKAVISFGRGMWGLSQSKVRVAAATISILYGLTLNSSSRGRLSVQS